MKLMRCESIVLKGEAEEIVVSPRPISQWKRGKKSNPYSTGGLDKFESVISELSAKREYIAKNIGAPEALVRFMYSKNEWIALVATPREGIGKKNGVRGDIVALILGPPEKNNGKEYGELRRNDEGNHINGRSERISISGFHKRSHCLVMSWSRFLKITTFGFLGLIAMWVRRPTISSAAAMALVMRVGGMMCTNKFILSGVSYFTTLFRNPRNPKTSQNEGGVEEIVEQRDVYKLDRRNSIMGLTGSAQSSPLRDHVQPIEFSTSASPRDEEQKTIDPEDKYHQSKPKKFRRVVSMENRPIRTPRPQDSDRFYARTSPTMANDGSVGATIMIIMLLCLVFYGRFCAILLTSAWWYLFPIFVEQKMSEMNRNNNSRMVDLQSNEYKM